MFDLLLFAYVIRCLLEYPHHRPRILAAARLFAFGLAMTNNWAMIGFFPAFVVALVWIKGLSFFNLRFLARMSLCGLAGLLLYLRAAARARGRIAPPRAVLAGSEAQPDCAEAHSPVAVLQAQPA